MCVQPNALARKAIQHMVLYCLTPPLFDRYSCLNLCLPYPAGDGIGYGIEPMRHLSEGGGICLVNSLAGPKTEQCPRTNGHCPSQGVHVA